MPPSRSLFLIAVSLVGLYGAAAFAEGKPSASAVPAAADAEAPVPDIGAPAEAKPERPAYSSGDFLSGRFAGVAGDRASAIAYLEQALSEDPQNHALAGQLLVLYLSVGDIPKAAERARQLQADADHERIVDLVLAVEAAHDGQFAEGEKALRNAFSQAKGVIWLPLLQAWLKAGRNELKKPLQPADILPEGETKAPPFLAYHLALLNDFAGFPEMAATQYALAVADPQKAPFRAIEAAADFYRRHGENNKLAALKLAYTAAHPQMSMLMDSDDASQMAALMNAHEEERQSTPALINTPQAGLAEVLFTMASVLYSAEAAQDTILYLRMALYLRQDFSLAQLLLGNVLENEGDFAGAAAVYGAVNPKSPLFSRALLRKAYMVEAQGKTEEAIKMLDARAAAHSDEYDTYVVKGDLLRNRSRFAEAAEAYSQALARINEREPQHWSIFFARATCFDRIGRWEQTESDLREALKLDPNQPEVLNYLGFSLLERNQRLEEARELIEQAYALQPDSAQIIDSMGWAHYKTGDIDGAVQFLEQAIELLPSDATVNDHLGDAYWQAGRKTEARYQWQQALSFKPEPKEEAVIRRKLKEGLPPLPAASVAEKKTQPMAGQAEPKEENAAP